MRRNWFISAGIAVVGLLAGVGIAGRPLASDSFIIDAAVAGSSTTSDTRAPASTEEPPVPSTVDVTSTVESVSTVVSTTNAPAPSTTSTIPPTTSSTVEPAPTTAPTTSVGPPVDQTLDRADVRLVLANGDGRFNLVGANKARLEAAGYVTINQEDVAGADATVLYYRPGFDDEAAILAGDLLVPQAILQPLPDTPVTDNDAAGDIIVVLGPDALR